MSLLTRYLVMRFVKPFLFSLALFALLIFLGDMFDKMHYLAKSQAPFSAILTYLWLQVPYWTVRTIPMATLLATLAALTGFIQSGEWIAVQAAGLPPRDFWKPLLLCSLVVTVLSFAAQETVLPACYKRARRLWQDKIHPEWEWDKHFDVALLGAAGEFLQAKEFRPKEGRMERVILERMGPEGLQNQLDAAVALWDQELGLWVFKDGVERRFLRGRLVEEAFTSRASELTVPPRQLVPRTRNPDEMSLRELRHYAEGLSRLGVPLREIRMAAHAKVAYPFTNFVICALGIPVALRLRRSSKVLSFLAALALSFVYLFVMEFGRALGASGQAWPWAAAWAPHLVFGAAAWRLIRRVEASPS